MARGAVFSAPLSAILWCMIFLACGLSDLAIIAAFLLLITGPIAVCLVTKEKRDEHNRLS